MIKTCTKCKQNKSLNEFCKDKSRKDKRYCICRSCTKKYRQENKKRASVYRKKYYQENKEKCAAFSKKYYLVHKKQSAEHTRINNLKKYGLTLKQYDEMFEKQSGNCIICGLPELMRRLSVDHDHETGKIRALLCERCNLLLGRVESNPELVIKMLEYLEIQEITKLEKQSE